MHRSPVRITGTGLLAIYLGLFLMQLDVSIVNVALNNIQLNLGSGSSQRLPWIIDGYTLPIAVLMLTAGTLGDRVGHKRLYAGGLVIFFIGTIACAFAPSLNALIAARVLQGIGASSLAPSSLALLVRAFPEPYAQQKAVGRWAAIGGLGLVLGPFAGGALTSLFGWSAVFVVTAIAAAIAILATIHLHERREAMTRPLDLPGIVTGSIVLAALVTAFIEGPHTGWTSAMTLASLAVFAVATAAFIAIERCSPAPMLPLVVFRRPSFVVVNLAATLMTFGNIGFLFVYGLFLQQEQDLSAFRAGLRMLPITIALVIGSTFTHLLVKRTGASKTVALGFGAEVVALLLILLLGRDAPYVAIAPLLVVLGLGTGMEISAVVAVGVRVLPPEEAGVASAVVNTSRQVGTALGAALIGSVYGAGGWEHYRLALMIAIAGFAIGVFAILLGLTGQPGRVPAAATCRQT